jgi:hypothetical protein
MWDTSRSLSLLLFVSLTLGALAPREPTFAPAEKAVKVPRPVWRMRKDGKAVKCWGTPYLVWDIQASPPRPRLLVDVCEDEQVWGVELRD